MLGPPSVRHHERADVEVDASSGLVPNLRLEALDRVAVPDKLPHTAAMALDWLAPVTPGMKDVAALTPDSVPL